MEKLDQLIGTIAEQLAALANTHGAQAVELGMFVFRIPHMQTLMTGFIFLALTIVALILLFYTLKKSWVTMHYGSEDINRHFILGVSSIVAGGICLLGTAINLGSITAWVGAFNGPAAVAIAVLNKLVK